MIQCRKYSLPSQEKIEKWHDATTKTILRTRGNTKGDFFWQLMQAHHKGWENACPCKDCLIENVLRELEGKI